MSNLEEIMELAKEIKSLRAQVEALASEKAALVRERDEAKRLRDWSTLDEGGWKGEAMKQKARAEKAEADLAEARKRVEELERAIRDCPHHLKEELAVQSALLNECREALEKIKQGAWADYGGSISIGEGNEMVDIADFISAVLARLPAPDATEKKEPTMADEIAREDVRHEDDEPPSPSAAEGEKA